MNRNVGSLQSYTAATVVHMEITIVPCRIINSVLQRFAIKEHKRDISGWVNTVVSCSVKGKDGIVISLIGDADTQYTIIDDSPPHFYSFHTTRIGDKVEMSVKPGNTVSAEDFKNNSLCERMHW